MNWRRFGLVSVTWQDDDDVAGRAAGRLAAELLVPPSNVRAGLVWWSTGRVTHRVWLHIDRDGRLVDVDLRPWDNPDEKEFTKAHFGVASHGEKRSEEYELPSSFTAGGWPDRRSFYCGAGDARVL